MNVNKISQWRPWHDNLCSSCTAYCCSLRIEVDLIDLIRLGIVTKEESEGNFRSLARKLESQGKIESFNEGSETFLLGKKPSDRTCIFLGSDKRCTVYEKRPDACRVFPTKGAREMHCPYMPRKSKLPEKNADNP